MDSISSQLENGQTANLVDPIGYMESWDVESVTVVEDFREQEYESVAEMREDYDGNFDNIDAGEFSIEQRDEGDYLIAESVRYSDRGSNRSREVDVEGLLSSPGPTEQDRIRRN